MAETVFDRFHEFSERPAVIEGNTSTSYAELAGLGEGIASQVAAGTLVLVVCANSLPPIAAYTGLMRAGRAQMLVHHSIKPDQLSEIVEAFQPHYVFVPPTLASALLLGQPVITVGDFGLYRCDKAPTYPISEDLAVLLSTSGTTGSRVFVRLSHRNLRANARSIIEYLGIVGDDRAITTMPMSYSYGLSIVNTHLAAGATIIATEAPLVGREFWDVLGQHRATTFGGVPFIYQMLDKLRFADKDLPYLRYLTQAGGRMPAALAAKFVDICGTKGIGYVTMYGQTEATARISYLPPHAARDKAGSIGIPIPGGRIWLEDDAGREIDAADTPGELFYAGDNVSLGYAESYRDLARGDENGGVIATGDMAVRDRDGFFFITGRKKRFLKVFGERVNLDEVEQRLGTYGIECACDGDDDMLRIFVVDGTEQSDVRAALRVITNLHPRGIEIVSIPEIPRNTAGKIAYPELTARPRLDAHA